MNSILSIKNLTFSYNDHLIFENLEINLNEGEFLSIVGPNGCGKTTLLKILSYELETSAEIVILGQKLNRENINSIRQDISFVFDLNDYDFICDTVRDEIILVLENLGFNHSDMEEMLDGISFKLKIKDILDKDPRTLTFLDKEKVLLACALVNRPKILVIDASYSTLNEYELKMLFDTLVEIRKNDNLAIMLLTRNLNEALYGDKIIVVDRRHKILEGKTLEVLKKDRVFSRLGIQLPFMVDLSLKLKFYELLEDIILNKKEMVGVLWK